VSDIGQSEGMPDEKTITVYCAAESHQLWERTYSRRGDDFWTPDPWDRFDGERAKMSRRGGGVEFIDATGNVIRSWDFGRASGGLHPHTGERAMGDIDRARQVARLSDDATLPVGRRYRIRCPLCGDGVRRSDSTADLEFDLLWEKGFLRISLDGLRNLRKLLGLS
jgi:hypothetical protein